MDRLSSEEAGLKSRSQNSEKIDMAIEVLTENRKQYSSGQIRSAALKKHITASFAVKAGSIVVNLLLVPLTITYVNPTHYGVWITIFSIITWFNFIDLGLGNGLRNKFAESLARNETQKAKAYVSTAYSTLTLFALALFLLFAGANMFIDWSFLLNAPMIPRSELSVVMLVTFGLFSVRFIAQLIGTILIADQKPAYNNVINFISSIISLAVIYLLIRTGSGSLLYLSIAMSLPPVLIYIVVSLYLFRDQYCDYKPALRLPDMSYAKELAAPGFRFFIIQVSAVILFTTDNLIITQLFGPSEVTPYNISYRYFSTVILLFTIIAAPFWSAFTESYVKGDIDWIKRVVRKLIILWSGLVVICAFAVLSAPLVYKYWIGSSVEIPAMLSVSMGVYVIVYTWTYIFITFLNGTGNIKIQLIHSVAVAIINIPLSIILAKHTGLHTGGVIIATTVCIAIAAVWSPLQYFKIIKGTAHGIWKS